MRMYEFIRKSQEEGWELYRVEVFVSEIAVAAIYYPRMERVQEPAWDVDDIYFVGDRGEIIVHNYSEPSWNVEEVQGVPELKAPDLRNIKIEPTRGIRITVSLKKGGKT